MHFFACSTEIKLLLLQGCYFLERESSYCCRRGSYSHYFLLHLWVLNSMASLFTAQHCLLWKEYALFTNPYPYLLSNKITLCMGSVPVLLL